MAALAALVYVCSLVAFSPRHCHADYRQARGPTRVQRFLKIEKEYSTKVRREAQPRCGARLDESAAFHTRHAIVNLRVNERAALLHRARDQRLCGNDEFQFYQSWRQRRPTYLWTEEIRSQSSPRLHSPMASFSHLLEMTLNGSPPSRGRNTHPSFSPPYLPGPRESAFLRSSSELRASWPNLK